jgi:hypothetical protein
MTDWPDKNVENERSLRLEFALILGLIIIATMIAWAM